MYLQREEGHMFLANNFFKLQEEATLGGHVQSGKAWRLREKGILSLNETEELFTEAKMRTRLRV